MKTNQIMISSLSVLVLSCSSALAESCGEECNFTFTTDEDGYKIITIENGTTSIPDNAFYDMNDIGEVIIPDSVISIGNNAFAGIKTLESLTIPDSVTSIGNSAFEGTRFYSHLKKGGFFLILYGF